MNSTEIRWYTIFYCCAMKLQKKTMIRFYILVSSSMFELVHDCAQKNYPFSLWVHNHSFMSCCTKQYVSTILAINIFNSQYKNHPFALFRSGTRILMFSDTSKVPKNNTKHTTRTTVREKEWWWDHYKKKRSSLHLIMKCSTARSMSNYMDTL